MDRFPKHLESVRSRFSAHPYQLPFRVPLRTAHGMWAERKGWWIRRESDDGEVLWGEVAPIPGFGGLGADGIESVLGQRGTQLTPTDIESILERGGEPAFGVGATFWDWRAAIEGGPDYLPVAGLLPSGESVFPALDRRLDMGFRTLKWKVGVGDARDEMAMLDDVMAKLPAGSRLRLDANEAWDRRTAKRWLSACAERPMIDYIEQPVERGAVDLLLGLAGDFPVTLALDESVCGRKDFERWLNLGWEGVFVIKPALWGQPCDLVGTLLSSEADVVISSALETAVGARVMLAVAFALGAGGRALGTGVWPLFQQSGMEGPSMAPFVRKSDVINLDVESVARRVGEL